MLVLKSLKPPVGMINQGLPGPFNVFPAPDMQLPVCLLEVSETDSFYIHLPVTALSGFSYSPFTQDKVIKGGN